MLLILTGIRLCRAAENTENDVQTAWRLLDYIAVDYSGAVSSGHVTSDAEYAEQVEFAATVSAKIGALPPKPEQHALTTTVAKLQRAIDDKADPNVVAELARSVASELLTVYPVPLAPTLAPSYARGAELFGQACASCHGATGDGHGPAAAGLSTPPIAFIDLGRARQRSVFALYQVIAQGIDDTPMLSFAQLPTSDRWALAFYAGHFAFSDPQAAEGETLWKSDASIRDLIPDLKTLVGMTPAMLETKLGEANADAVTAYVRRHPEIVGPPVMRPLALARDRLAESLAAYQSGHRREAGELALSAYLDGLEPAEPALGARDSALLNRIEGAMGEYRAAIQHAENPAAISKQAELINALLDDAESVLTSNAASDLSTFLGAATILLREGLEALLIVVAMIAFLRKAERPEALPYVHAGWVAALVAGLITWIIATWIIGISGASRELTEGFGSVVAAIVLLSVGIWMHGKAHADGWQRYVREKMAKALSGRSAWLLFGLAFIVVYREVFETILFYAALWTQGNGLAMSLGAASACVALAVIAWIMLRYSRRLPIGKFFMYSAWLMAALTVILAGKGIAALQEAGIVGITPIDLVPRLSLVGLFPTLQTLAAQLLAVVALGVGFMWNGRKVAG
jgi:high-affinity iron transporter